MYNYQLLNSQVSFVRTLCQRCREGGEDRLARVLAAVSDAAPDWHRHESGCHPGLSRVIEAYTGTWEASPRKVDAFEDACLEYLTELDRIAVRQARYQGALSNLCDRYRYAAAQA